MLGLWVKDDISGIGTVTFLCGQISLWHLDTAYRIMIPGLRSAAPVGVSSTTHITKINGSKIRRGIFLLVYILLALTFGYTMIVAESALGRMTQKSPVGAFRSFGKKKWISFGGWINAIIPILIVPYYSVIGGWVIKYLAEYIRGNGTKLAEDGYFGSFISNGVSTELCFVIFCLITLAIIYAGVQNGIERVSKLMMPVLVLLSVVIAIYSVTRPGAIEGVKYFLVPNVKNFSWMTVVAAMGQMFYSLSIAMGILITFGSYMKKDTSMKVRREM